MDCTTPLEKIISRCKKLGINCIAIADHGTIEGALKMQSIAPFRVIVAEEILTPYGEIMGMFLKEGIPGGLSVAETISQIKAQDGIVCIPHPFDALRPSALGNSIPIEPFVKQVDVIEVFNARTVLDRYTKKAMNLARKYAIPGSAGSDAHTLPEIGNAYIEMPEFDGKDDFLQALAKGNIGGHKTSPLTHFGSAWSRIKKRL